MVIFIKQNTKEERIQELLQWIESQNLRTHVSTGACSPETQARMDRKVTELVSQQYRRAAELLRANEGRLHQLASYLYEHETITGEEFMEILSRSSPELDAPVEQPET